MLPKHTGITRIFKALGHSRAGLASAYRTEAAFRQEVWLAAMLVPVALLVDVGLLERTLLIGSLLLVMIVELLNSGIEAVVDRISLERHELSKHAKDVGSAAVLLALINLAGVWASVLWLRYGA
ncbi:MAG TPA: diacylglycerol kinase [Rhodocyclaceae bacterium]|nr:diacylglycerol kinase [Rhodocyclaceae bacterium]